MNVEDGNFPSYLAFVLVIVLYFYSVPSAADYAVKTIKWSTTETVRLHVRTYVHHMTPFNSHA